MIDLRSAFLQQSYIQFPISDQCHQTSALFLRVAMVLSSLMGIRWHLMALSANTCYIVFKADGMS